MPEQSCTCRSTQGSGKSLSMVFYAHRLQEALDSPTIVVLTDRNDLDDQLFGQFAKCKDFLRQEPMHAESREHLKSLLDGRQANGIIFTTMQKFEESHEPLSERRNIVVMADEAHRGQYGLSEKVDAETGKIKIGTARIIRNSLPNATYIGFTGTPISMKDRSTREVFGDYIDVYDMTQAVEDGATRPVYYESRVIRLKLDEATLKLIDTEYDIMANNADPEVIEKSKRELGQMEAILGNDQTIASLVDDILDHYENYRADLLTGKAMIVAYSRAIAMKIYNRILELRPSWTEKIAVVMTESNKDPEEWRAVIGNKRHKDELAKKFKDNDSPLKIAIVVDMWLTGFDVPSLATKKISLPEMNARINALLSQSVKSEGVINLFSDVSEEFSLFDPKFLEEISKMKEKNLAVELLKKLIAEQVQIYRRTNVVKSEKFSEIIQSAMNRYLNGMLTNEEVIQELLNLAKQIAAAQKEGDWLGLTADELAFYDALTKPQAIKDFYENEELIAITKELADTLRKNRTIDWQKRDSARAKMRMMIKKLLKKHRYPPEGMDDAVQTVMTQCELWTDNADMEQREHKAVNYSFRHEQNLSMVAEEPAPYGKKD